MKIDLNGKVALVTGPTNGIGCAAAVGLTECGTKVIVNGWRSLNHPRNPN